MRYVIKELRTKEQDFDVLKLGTQFVGDVDYNEYINKEAVIIACNRCRADIERDDINVFIAYEDDEPIGFFVGIIGTYFHRAGRYAEQRLLFVIPNRRGTIVAKLLIQAYETWATEHGATQIFTGITNQRYSERFSKFLTHLGYKHVGALFVKDSAK